MLHIDEFAERTAARSREARLREQALFTARFFKNGWAIVKTSAYYAREASGWWVTVIVPILTWSAVLEYGFWYFLPPLKIVTVGLFLLLYTYILLRVKKYLSMREASPSGTTDNFPKSCNERNLDKSASKIKGWRLSIAHIVATAIRMFWDGTDAMHGALLAYRTVFVGGALVLTILTVIMPNSELGATYFARLNAWPINQLLTRIGVTPENIHPVQLSMGWARHSEATIPQEFLGRFSVYK